MPIVSASSSSSSLKKKATEQKPKPSMSLRTIGRMGQSMSSMMPTKQKTTTEEKIKEESDTTAEGELDHTPLPTINISTKVWEQAQDNLLTDIQEVRRAMDLFLNSRIPEAEQILEPKRHSTLYHSLGHSFVLFLKSVMTFQHTDIEAAIEALKKTIQLADALRKKETGWFGNITSWVKGITVHDIWAMSRLHRHAVSSWII
jgi:hypothetical protein